MQFTTESGSIYEVDTDKKRIRRVTNINGTEATHRQSANQWKDYEFVTEIKVGAPVLIGWIKSETPLMPGSPKHGAPATLTSFVTTVTA